jgi:C-terminal processing protease CtpA/Prc
LETLSAALEDLDLMSMTADDEALRLGDVVMAWNVFQHFYPYFDVIDTDWDAVLTEGLTRALSDPTDSEPTTEGFLGTLRWMVAQLHDGHGRVSGPTDPQAGFPIRLGWIEDQVVVVASEEPETFRVGDVLLTLDGEPATQRLEELARTISGSTQWKRWRALNTLTLGPAGSEATLELEREGGEVVTITRIRDSGDVPAETRPSNVAELEPGFFYVNLDRVTMEEFDARVEELAVARGVIFDLRGYPNGNHLALTHLSDEPLRSAYWRVPQIIYPDHEPGLGGELHYAESRWNLPPREPRFQGQIAFITDGRAISYAESVMGIVEHYGLGEIVGQTTAGANGNVNPFILPGRYRFSWTGMQVIKHDGSQHHLVGIHPTVPATRTIQGVREGRDELLERALEVVSGG